MTQARDMNKALSLGRKFALVVVERTKAEHGTNVRLVEICEREPRGNGGRVVLSFDIGWLEDLLDVLELAQERIDHDD